MWVINCACRPSSERRRCSLRGPPPPLSPFDFNHRKNAPQAIPLRTCQHTPQPPPPPPHSTPVIWPAKRTIRLAAQAHSDPHPTGGELMKSIPVNAPSGRRSISSPGIIRSQPLSGPRISSCLKSGPYYYNVPSLLRAQLHHGVAWCRDHGFASGHTASRPNRQVRTPFCHHPRSETAVKSSPRFSPL